MATYKCTVGVYSTQRGYREAHHIVVSDHMEDATDVAIERTELGMYPDEAVTEVEWEIVDTTT